MPIPSPLWSRYESLLLLLAAALVLPVPALARSGAPAAAVALATATRDPAEIGSMTPALPPGGCVTVMVGNVMHQPCGPTGFQPQCVDTSVQYVVVAPL